MGEVNITKPKSTDTSTGKSSVKRGNPRERERERENKQRASERCLFVQHLEKSERYPSQSIFISFSSRFMSKGARFSPSSLVEESKGILSFAGEKSVNSDYRLNSTYLDWWRCGTSHHFIILCRQATGSVIGNVHTIHARENVGLFL